MVTQFVEFVRSTYRTDEFIPLHEPRFLGNEKTYLLETIDSTFVSSVGAFVDKFEEELKCFTNAQGVVVTSSGTSALHTAMYLAGVRPQDLVITPALTFVAACNAIHHMQAEPLFIDIDENLCLSADALEGFLEEEALLNGEKLCVHKKSGRIIRAAIPMHTFGHPADMDSLQAVCTKWGVSIIEDAAESLGSFYKGAHTGTLSRFGAISFNGNKIITTGGGGAVLCGADDAVRAKHITTTAKKPHPYEFFHDEAGFNYRMPNLNAALGLAQLERINIILKQKRELSEAYQQFFKNSEYVFVTEPEYAQSNYWLNAVICEDKTARDYLLTQTNAKGIMTRPVWTLMHRLPMYRDSYRGNLEYSEWMEQRLVNIPSSAMNGD